MSRCEYNITVRDASSITGIYIVTSLIHQLNALVQRRQGAKRVESDIFSVLLESNLSTDSQLRFFITAEVDRKRPTYRNRAACNENINEKLKRKNKTDLADSLPLPPDSRKIEIKIEDEVN